MQDYACFALENYEICMKFARCLPDFMPVGMGVAARFIYIKRF